METLEEYHNLLDENNYDQFRANIINSDYQDLNSKLLENGKPDEAIKANLERMVLGFRLK